MNRLASIVVPTFNRERILVRLLAFFSRISAQLRYCDIELVFSNNHSTDSTSHLLSDFAHKNSDIDVRIISPPIFLPSGEENMTWACSQACGEYVWIIADDDLPSLGALSHIYKILRSRQYDLIIANACYGRDVEESVSRYFSHYPRNAAIVYSPYDSEGSAYDLASNLGPLNLFCNFSGLIFKRRHFLDCSQSYHGIERTNIYSHVFALLESFGNSRCYFISAPLVSIDTAYSDDHWNRLASSHGVPPRYFWHAGLHKKVAAFKLRNPHDAGRIDSLFLRSLMPIGSCGDPSSSSFMLPELINQLFLDLNDDLHSSPDGLTYLIDCGTINAMIYYFECLSFCDKKQKSSFDQLQKYLLDLGGKPLCIPDRWNRSKIFRTALLTSWQTVTALSCKHPKVMSSGQLPSPYPLLNYEMALTESQHSCIQGASNAATKAGSLSKPAPFCVGSRISVVDTNRLSCHQAIDVFQSTLMSSWPSSPQS